MLDLNRTMFNTCITASSLYIEYVIENLITLFYIK